MDAERVKNIGWITELAKGLVMGHSGSTSLALLKSLGLYSTKQEKGRAVFSVHEEYNPAYVIKNFL